MTAMDFSSSIGCIIIHPIPSALQSVFKNTGLLGLYCASIGDDVIDTFTSSNNLTRSEVYDITGISDQKYNLMRARRGLIRISKFGA